MKIKIPLNLIHNILKIPRVDDFVAESDHYGRRIRFFSLVAVHLLCMIYLLVFGVMAICENKLILAAAEFVIFGIAVINMFLLYKYRLQRFASWVLLSAASLLLLFLLVYGSSDGSAHLWLFSLCCTAMLFLKRREGTIFISIFLVLVVLLLMLPLRLHYRYSLHFKLRLIGSLLLVYMVLMTYELFIAFSFSQLMRRHRRYLDLYNNVPIGLYSASADGKLIATNRALAEIFGYSNADQLLQAGLYMPATLSEVLSKQLLLERRIDGIIRKLRRADGTEIVIRENIRLNDSKGSAEEGYSAFEGSVEDITAIKNIEEIKESYKEDLLLLIASATRFCQADTARDVYRILSEQACALIFNAVIVITEFNPESSELRLTEYCVHPGLKSSLLDILGDYRRHCMAVDDAVIDVLCRGETVDVSNVMLEVLFKSLPASVCQEIKERLHTVRLYVCGIVFNKELYGCLTIIMDGGYNLLSEKRGMVETLCSQAAIMLKRNAAESALRKEHTLKEAFLDAMPIPAFYKDINGRYLGCNRAMEQFSGKSRDYMLGKTVHEIFPSYIANEYERHDKDALTTGGVQIHEFELKDASGYLRSLRCVISCVRGQNNETIGIVGAYVDMTQEKERQRAIAAAFMRQKKWLK